MFSKLLKKAVAAVEQVEEVATIKVAEIKKTDINPIKTLGVISGKGTSILSSIASSFKEGYEEGKK